MSGIVRFVRWFSRSIVWVAACALLTMMFLTCGDVVGRYIGYPIKGTYDVVGLLGTFVIALPLAYTQMLKRHVSMEFMSSHGNKLVQTIANSTVCLLGIGVYALIAWRCYVLGTKFFTVGRVSDTVALTLYPFVYVVAFGCALNCLVLLVDLYSGFVQLSKGSE